MKIRVNVLDGGHVILDNVESVNLILHEDDAGCIYVGSPWSAYEDRVRDLCQMVDATVNVERTKTLQEALVAYVPIEMRTAVRAMYNHWHNQV